MARLRGSSLYLDLPGVSPYHARVVVEGSKVTVHDTGSSRTVHVNDNALDREGTELRNGDILWLGVPGEEDVVMMQCILPRRAPAPAPVAPPEPEPPAEAAEPTPDIETVALWAREGKSEPATEGASGNVEAEEPGAEAEDAPPPPDVVEAAPAHLPGFIDDFESEVAAAAIEPQAPAAPVDETYRLDTTETVNEVPEEVAPTLLMGSADEVEPGFVEPLPSEHEFESYQTIPAADEPVVEAAAVPEAGRRSGPAGRREASGAGATPAAGGATACDDTAAAALGLAAHAPRTGAPDGAGTRRGWRGCGAEGRALGTADARHRRRHRRARARRRGLLRVARDEPEPGAARADPDSGRARQRAAALPSPRPSRRPPRRRRSNPRRPSRWRRRRRS